VTSHPLDTIKTRMQLRQASGSKYGLFMTGYRIVQKESFLALYKVQSNAPLCSMTKDLRPSGSSACENIAINKCPCIHRFPRFSNASLYRCTQGLTAVYMGIIPKMAVRFSSFEAYKELLAGPDGKVSGPKYRLGHTHGMASVRTAVQ
jgi:solute carrier family 25 citrate transporter 1